MISEIHTARSNGKEVQSYFCKDFMTENDIKVLMEEIIRETNISELCCKEGIDANSYFEWSKDFIRITRSKLVNTYNEDEISGEIVQLKNENLILSRLVVELSNEIQFLKKRLEKPSISNLN